MRTSPRESPDPCLRRRVRRRSPLAATVQVPAGAQSHADRARQAPRRTAKVPTARGSAARSSSVDPEATRVGLEVLEGGGNAVDAAVATAAALGVTEPYSAGIGGGGFFVYYDAETGKVHTIDGRETAPMAMPHDAFIDPRPASPTASRPTWSPAASRSACPAPPPPGSAALDRWGTRSLRQALAPGDRLARAASSSTRPSASRPPTTRSRFARVHLHPRAVPARRRRPRGRLDRSATPTSRDTYELLAERGLRAFYRGALAATIVRDGAQPAEDAEHRRCRCRPATCSGRDLARLPRRSTAAPTHSGYRGYDVYGMAPSSSRAARPSVRRSTSSSASTCRDDDRAGPAPLPRGERAGVRRPRQVRRRPGASSTSRSTTCSPTTFAAERACQINPTKAMTKPVAAGDVDDYDGDCADARRRGRRATTTPRTLDHQPDRRRPVGQRRRVHPHHRADRRLRHRRAGPRLPAQQRAHRLHRPVLRRRTTPTGSSPASGRAPRCRRRSCSRTASRSWRSARPAARRSSPPCCRCWSTGSTAA